MSVDAIIGSWREVRAGLIDEASQIPAGKFSFRAAEGMRTVAELLQHLVESQKFWARPMTLAWMSKLSSASTIFRIVCPRTFWPRRA